MKLVMDEKLKHRLIGLAVIISIAAIFAPAVLRKSSQNLETISVRVAVPPKPTAPDVVMSQEKDLFKTIKIAKVKLPETPMEEQLPQALKAEALSPSEKEIGKVSKTEPEIKPEPVNITTSATKAKPILAKPVTPSPAKSKPKLAVKATQPLKTNIARRAVPVKKDAYAVQLATFTRLANAQSLITKLKTKGYKANLTKIASKQGTIYKVSVGNSPNKNQAMLLRRQLATAVQLKGFVVNTGVS